MSPHIRVCAFSLPCLLLLAGGILGSGRGASPAQSRPDPKAEIVEVLTSQQAAWNRGDVRAFMSGYDNAETTAFVGRTLMRGYAQVLAGYLQRYPTRGSMGRLSFSGLEVQPLCSLYASVIGSWKLERGPEAGGNVGGMFTLLFQKTPAGWKIVLDHTS